MKKIIGLIGIICITMNGMVQANPFHHEPDLKEAFKKDFPAARLVGFNEVRGTYIVEFTQDNKTQFAYYDLKIRLTGTAFFTSLDKMPYASQIAVLKKKIPAVIRTIYQYTDTEFRTKYYVRFQSHEKRWVEEVDTEGRSIIIKESLSVKESTNQIK